MARSLEKRHHDVIARARHGGKFLDDTTKSFTDLRAEMQGFYDVHRREFLGKAIWGARWFESDIGIVLAHGDKILGTSIVLHFRTGLGTEVRLTDAGPALKSIAQELGGTLATFAKLDGDESTLSGTIDYRYLGHLREKDCRVIKYLGTRYDSEMDIPTKLLLLMVEGEANTTNEVVSLGRSVHREAVFRATLISLYHSLRAVDEILRSDASYASSGTQRLRSLLSEEATRRILDEPQVRRVRNRCMHYEIRETYLDLDPTRPMFGIVEGICTDTSFDALESDVRELNSRLGDALKNWHTRS